MHNKITKTEVARVLEDLSSSEKITSRAFGKVLIYSSKDNPIDYEKEFGDRSIERKYEYQSLIQLNEELMEVSRDETVVRKELEDLGKIPTNERLNQDVSIFEKDVITLQESIASIKENANTEQRLECTHIQNSIDSLEKEVKLRRKIFNNITSIIKDQVRPKSMNDFMEELGIENCM